MAGATDSQTCSGPLVRKWFPTSRWPVGLWLGAEGGELGAKPLPLRLKLQCEAGRCVGAEPLEAAVQRSLAVGPRRQDALFSSAPRGFTGPVHLIVNALVILCARCLELLREPRCRLRACQLKLPLQPPCVLPATAIQFLLEKS